MTRQNKNLDLCGIIDSLQYKVPEHLLNDLKQAHMSMETLLLDAHIGTNGPELRKVRGSFEDLKHTVKQLEGSPWLGFWRLFVTKRKIKKFCRQMQKLLAHSKFSPACSNPPTSDIGSITISVDPATSSRAEGDIPHNRPYNASGGQSGFHTSYTSVHTTGPVYAFSSNGISHVYIAGDYHRETTTIHSSVSNVGNITVNGVVVGRQEVPYPEWQSSY